MSPELIPSRIARMVAGLAPKAKQPNSSAVLNTWIAQAEGKLGPDASGGRLGWLVASSVAIAAVQRAVDADARQLFLIKGGTWLQHRLNATARTTKDVDGLVRGDGSSSRSRRTRQASARRSRLSSQRHWIGSAYLIRTC